MGALCRRSFEPKYHLSRKGHGKCSRAFPTVNASRGLWMFPQPLTHAPCLSGRLFQAAVDQPQMSKISLEKKEWREWAMKDIQIAVSAWFIVTFCPQLLFYGIAAIIPCSEKVAATGIPGGAMFPEHTVVSRGEREGSHPPPWPSLCCEPHHSILHVAFQPPGPCAQPLPQPCPASLSPPAPMWNSSRRLTWSRKKAGWQDGVHVSDLFIFFCPLMLWHFVFCIYHGNETDGHMRYD